MSAYPAPAFTDYEIKRYLRYLKGKKREAMQQAIAKAEDEMQRQYTLAKAEPKVEIVTALYRKFKEREREIDIQQRVKRGERIDKLNAKVNKHYPGAAYNEYGSAEQFMIAGLRTLKSHYEVKLTILQQDLNNSVGAKKEKAPATLPKDLQAKVDEAITLPKEDTDA